MFKKKVVTLGDYKIVGFNPKGKKTKKSEVASKADKKLNIKPEKDVHVPMPIK